MKFKFIGTEDGPKEIELYGYKFAKGGVVEVGDNHHLPLGKQGSLVKVVDKLSGNPHFEAVESEPKPSARRKSTKKAAE